MQVDDLFTPPRSTRSSLYASSARSVAGRIARQTARSAGRYVGQQLRRKLFQKGNTPKFNSTPLFKRRLLVNQQSSGNVKVGKSKRRGAKITTKGVKRVVKVPSKLKKQIKQVLKASDYHGWMIESSCQVLKPSDPQNVFNIGPRTTSPTAGLLPVMFSPFQVNNVASYLFNDKVYTSLPGYADARNFSERTFVLDVLKQSVTFRLKNNTARTLTLKFYNLSPKNKSFSNGWDVKTYWDNVLANDAANTPNNPNRNGCGSNTLWNTPMLHPMMRAQFSMEEIIYTLEPGKECTHKIMGPNMTYDFKKYWEGTTGTAGTFSNQQKMVKYCLLVVIPDLVTTTLEACGRWTDFDSLGGYGLIVETTVFTKIKVPEQTGFISNPIAGEPQLLNLKKHRYAIVAEGAGQTGTINEINDENPQAKATSGV